MNRNHDPLATTIFDENMMASLDTNKTPPFFDDSFCEFFAGDLLQRASSRI